MSAKGKVEDAARQALSQAGVAASEELKDMRKHIERLRSAWPSSRALPSPRPERDAGEQGDDAVAREEDAADTRPPLPAARSEEEADAVGRRRDCRLGLGRARGRESAGHDLDSAGVVPLLAVQGDGSGIAVSTRTRLPRTIGAGCGRYVPR